MKNQKRLRRAVNGILLLDKPIGLSSNDALQAVKRLFQAEKAGHTGSLDPLATGLLPICFGQATKLCGQMLDSDKRYLAEVRFGEKTATGDGEGEVTARSNLSGFGRADLERVLPQFHGEISQIPPMYSALKQDGQRLYELARQGIDVEREPRQIRIHELKLLRFDGAGCDLEVSCSKGTYIRTLVEDLAAAAGQCAYLRGLRRTGAGLFHLNDAHDMERLNRMADLGPAALDGLLLDTGAGLRDLPSIQVDDIRAQRLRQGLSQQLAGAPRNTRLAVQDLQGRLLCLAESDDGGAVAPKRWLAP